MKPLEQLSNTSLTSDAEVVMETVTQMMRAIRREMRRQRPTELSMPQFRALRVLRRQQQLSLSQLAAHLDLTLASASKLIDILEKHGFASRAASAVDRRQIVISLTAHGQEALHAVEVATHARLTEMLAHLPAVERAQVVQAMHILQALLETEAVKRGAQ